MPQTIRKKLLSVIAGLTLLTPMLQAQGNNPNFCWQQSYTRPIVGSQCPSGKTYNAGLCYSTCPSGYYDVGPVCWQSCPSGFKDIGVSCQKPGNLEVSAGKSRSQCGNGWGNGCYEDASLWYPNCPANYHSQGLLICSPNCPSGMADAGADCTKNTIDIGVGTVPSCGSGQEGDAGLCYPSCQSGFNGIGPVCWGTCSGNTPYQCGAACAVSKQACDRAVGNMVLNASAVAINILSFAFGGEAATSAIKEAAEAGDNAAFDQILSHTSTNWVSMVAGVGKEYAIAYGKQFVKTTLKNKLNSTLDERNMFWTFAQNSNSGALKALNASTTQYATAQTAPTNSLQMNTLISTAEQIDPTGIANLITSFTQYGSCSGSEDFAASPNQLDFGVTTNSAVTLPFTLSAQQPFTILRLGSPTLSNMAIIPTANCVGRLINPGESCTMYVTVSGGAQLDSELRIYTDNYPTVPETVHLLANQGVTSAPQAALFVPDQDALNMASLIGAWNFNGSVMTINADGSTSSGETVTITNANTRMIQITGGYYSSFSYFVDEAAENLINFEPFVINGHSFVLQSPSYGGSALAVTNNATTAGEQIGLDPLNGTSAENFTFRQQLDGSFELQTDNGQVLNVFGNSTADGANIIQWPDQGTANERFLVEPLTDGNIKLISVSSGEAISIGFNGSQAVFPAIQNPWTAAAGQEFSIKGALAPLVITKMPWGAGCNPGQTLYESMCYSVDIGYRMSSPGIEGKPCPVDWRDDGTYCWPPWTGVEVAAQADPNPDPASLTAYTMRHPIVVTSCTSYAAAKGQNCPANFQNIGGPGSCSCQAITQTKGIKTVTGFVPTS